MDKKAFFAQYQSDEWKQLSQKIMKRDHYTCQLCGCSNARLNVHHLYYPKSGNILDVPDRALITLCEKCHTVMHSQKDLITPTIKLIRRHITDFEILALLRALFYKGEYRLTKDEYDGSIYISLPIIKDNVTDTSLLSNLIAWHNRISNEQA